MNREQLERLTIAFSDILGPAGNSQVLESLIGAVISTSGDSAGGSTKGDRVIITCYGCDTPGVMAKLTNTLSDAGVNILDVSQKILQGYFTLIMIADMATTSLSLDEVKGSLESAGENLGMRVMVQHEDLFYAMHRP